MRSEIPSPSPPHRKILFHHIPKTAGTALIEHACALFGERVCPARYDQQLTEAAMTDERFVFYHGHFSQAAVGLFRQHNPDAFLFTFLRHPYPRVLSQYANWTDRERVDHEFRQLEGTQPGDAHVHALHAKFRQLIFDMSLEDFVSSHDPDVVHVASNLQAQYLTADASPDCVRFHNAVPNALMGYHFIGLQEFYAPCLRILEARCALPQDSLGGTKRANTSDVAKGEGGYAVSRELVRKLEACNAYDLALFYTVYAELYRNHGDVLPPIGTPIEELIGIRLT